MEMSIAAPAKPKKGGRTEMNNQAYTLKNTTWKMLFNATRPAAYSRFPSASSFQTITIAMQRARPIRIRPVMYAGLSGRKRIASRNINTGPITQLRRREAPNTFGRLKTDGSFSYCTLVKGGYIMRISPTASGRLTLPEESAWMLAGKAGTKWPSPMPTTMARKIQRVR